MYNMTKNVDFIESFNHRVRWFRPKSKWNTKFVGWYYLKSTVNDTIAMELNDSNPWTYLAHKTERQTAFIYDDFRTALLGKFVGFEMKSGREVQIKGFRQV